MAQGARPDKPAGSSQRRLRTVRWGQGRESRCRRRGVIRIAWIYTVSSAIHVAEAQRTELFENPCCRVA